MQYGRSGLVGRNPDVLSALTDQPRLTKQAGEKDRPGTITLCQMRRLSGIPTKRESALHEALNFTDRRVCLQAVFRIATFPIFNRYPLFFITVGSRRSTSSQSATFSRPENTHLRVHRDPHGAVQHSEWPGTAVHSLRQRGIKLPRIRSNPASVRRPCPDAPQASHSNR